MNVEITMVFVVKSVKAGMKKQVYMNAQLVETNVAK